MSYAIPVDAPVSCSWQCHRDREPPSGEPGTDYASDYGTPIAAAGDGWISDAKYDSGGAAGRYIQITLDDGRTVRYLHLSELWRGYGTRVSRGEGIAASGGSGHGSDHGYGSHVHTTLWDGPAWSGPTIDFAQYAGEEDDMPLNADTDYAAFSTMLTRALRYDTRPHGNGSTQEYGPTVWERLDRLESGLGAKIDADDSPTPPDPCADQKESKLVTPAWIAGVFLGLIGLVEVIRFIFDLLT